MNKLILEGGSGGNTATSISLMVVLFGALAFYMIWSVRRRKNVHSQVEKMLDELRPGQRVRTLGGIIGRIKEIREESPARTNEKGVVTPAVRTVLLQTGSDKNPSFMLFDIQAIYGVFPEEGHTLEGMPVVKNSPAPETKEALQDPTDLNAREYLEKRNVAVQGGKKKK